MTRFVLVVGGSTAGKNRAAWSPYAPRANQRLILPDELRIHEDAIERTP